MHIILVIMLTFIGSLAICLLWTILFFSAFSLKKTKISLAFLLIAIVVSNVFYLTAIKQEGFSDYYYTDEYSNENMCELVELNDIRQIDAHQTDTTNITKLKISFDPWHSDRFHSEIKDFEWLHKSIKEIEKMKCINNGGEWSNKVDSCIYCD